MYVLRVTEVVRRLLYRGVLNKVYGEALPRGPSPDPFILIPVPFLTETVALSYTFVYLPLKNSESLSFSCNF